MMTLAAGSMLNLVLASLLLVSVVAGLWLLARYLEAQKKAKAPATAIEDDEDAAARVAVSYPYQARATVLSPGERAFWPVLNEAVRRLAAALERPVPIVLASVRFAEILAVDAPRNANGSAWQSAQNRITSKQADFVLCHPDTTQPLLVIELDDKTHERGGRKERDEFVDKACASAKLPVLHIKAAAGYDADAVARLIAEKLGVALPQRTSKPGMTGVPGGRV